MKKALTIIFFIFPFLLFGQKFMIEGKDTLPYHEKMIIKTDSLHHSDTTYEGACKTFEKINGRIVNRSDSICQRQGLWIVKDSIGDYSTGNYVDGYEAGLWKQFDKNNNLLKETEIVHFDRDSYLVKEVDYVNGQRLVIVDKPFFGFYIKYQGWIMALFFITFFSRVFVNSQIYNIERNTNFTPIYVSLPGYVSKNYYHSLLSTFTLWFFKYKPENRQRVMLSHILSIVSVGGFLMSLIGLAIGGELH